MDFLKKYSLLGGLTEFATQMCETLNRTTGRIAVITDRDNIIALAGAPRRELLDKQIAPELERLMESRQIYQHKVGEIGVPLCAEEGRFFLDTVAPILSEGDVLGSVVFTAPEEKPHRRRGGVQAGPVHRCVPGEAYGGLMADPLSKIRLSAGENGREAYGTQRRTMKTAPANGRRC